MAVLVLPRRNYNDKITPEEQLIFLLLNTPYNACRMLRMDIDTYKSKLANLVTLGYLKKEGNNYRKLPFAQFEVIPSNLILDPDLSIEEMLYLLAVKQYVYKCTGQINYSTNKLAARLNMPLETIELCECLLESRGILRIEGALRFINYEGFVYDYEEPDEPKEMPNFIVINLNTLDVKASRSKDDLLQRIQKAEELLHSKVEKYQKQQKSSTNDKTDNPQD